MTKKHFIALANAIREHNQTADPDGYTTSREFSRGQLDVLADFCRTQNPRFDRERWLDYIAGRCGSNGGKVKTGEPPTNYGTETLRISKALESYGMT